MAVARVRQLTNAASVTSNSIPVSNASWSPAAAIGNLMIITLQLYGTSAIGITTPSGWTLATSGTATNSTTRNYTAILYRSAVGTASADTITSITTSGALSGRWVIEEWSGLASKAIVSQTGTAVAYTTASSGTAVTVGTPSPGVANTFTYAGYGQRTNAAPTAVTYTWSSGYTVALAPNGTAQNNLGTAYKVNTTSGSQGALTVTQTTTGTTNLASEAVFMVFNQQGTPVANFTVSVSGAVATVTSTSTSTYTNILTYGWNWGDGTSTSPLTATTATHSYASSGTYTITLTVTDDRGTQATKTNSAAVAIDLSGWITTGSSVYPGYLYYWDGTAQRALGGTATYFDQRSGTYYSSFFTGANGAALPAEWTTTLSSSGSSANIQNNKMSLVTAPVAWEGGPKAFLSGLTGIDDFEVTFDMTLGSLNQQYPYFSFRVVDDSTYSSGAGTNIVKTGYSIIFGPNSNTIDIQEGLTADNNNPKASFAYTFTSSAFKLRINASQKTLKIKIWASNIAEPTTWNYQGDILKFQLSGRMLFGHGNGAAASSNSALIDNFQIRSTRQQPALLDIQPAPVGNLTNFRQVYVENFDTVADANGPFKTAYANSWQPFNDEGIYYPNQMVSAHDGAMDIRLDGTKGAAGTFGAPADAFNRVGGRFSMRAKAIGGDGNGAAVMVWPSSDVWNEGEIDYPEANFETTPFVHHHVMNQGDNSAAEDYDTTVSWRDWHIYTIEWIPGVSVKYYLDGVALLTVTSNVPTTAHRYQVQTGNYGSPGNMYIDWVSIWAYDTSVTGDSVNYGSGTYGQGIYG